MNRIEPGIFRGELASHGVDFFAGVPDSLLQDLCACLEAECPAGHNVIAANEGNAVAMACGYHVATGRYAGVYLQNSGLGNTVNPLLSLADPDVYSIPMLLIIGWRGEPGISDEPQHVTQGRLTLPLLQSLGIDYLVLDPRVWQDQVAEALDRMRRRNAPVALVVRKGTFVRYAADLPATSLVLTREETLAQVVAAVDPADFIVSTTGKTSRELFELRERGGQPHDHDFLTVGGMGHAASIAFGMSLGTDRLVYCVDGDGAFLMHLGSLAVAAQQAPENFRYLMVNNGAHESVGGQPTVGFEIDAEAILRGCGFQQVETVAEASGLPAALRRLAARPGSALIVQVAQGSRPDLGRPTVSPVANKVAMMRAFGIDLA